MAFYVLTYTDVGIYKEGEFCVLVESEDRLAANGWAMLDQHGIPRMKSLDDMAFDIPTRSGFAIHKFEYLDECKKFALDVLGSYVGPAKHSNIYIDIGKVYVFMQTTTDEKIYIRVMCEYQALRNQFLLRGKDGNIIPMEMPAFHTWGFDVYDDAKQFANILASNMKHHGMVFEDFIGNMFHS